MSPRQPWEDALSMAQHDRTQARLAWIDHLVNSLIAVWPDKAPDLELMRIDLRDANDAYVETLNKADLALINRVSAMLLNEQLSREVGDEAIRKQLEGLG